ncbi:MAG: diguanylate cyclase [Sulfuricurvum sp.]
MEATVFLSLLLLLLLASITGIAYKRLRIDSKSGYGDFFERSPIPLVIIDHNHQIVGWNPSAETVFGWEAVETVGKDMLHFLISEFDRNAFLNNLERAVREGKSFSNHCALKKTGEELWCEWHTERLNGSHGEILCMARDVSVIHNIFEEQRLRSIAFDAAEIPLVSTDPEGWIVIANRSFNALGFTDPKNLSVTSLGSLFNDLDDLFGTIRLNPNALPIDPITLSAQCGGEKKYFDARITPLETNGILKGFAVALYDITQNRLMMDRLTHKSRHDPLTGAANRSAMIENLRHAIRHARHEHEGLALFFIDLNDFKQVNDRYGHDAGDRLLQEISSNLKNSLRTCDTVCRYGGDEFVIIAEHIDGEEEIQSVYRSIQETVTQPIRLEENRLFFPSASIGIARYPDQGETETDLIRAADQSMYLQKQER